MTHKDYELIAKVIGDSYEHQNGNTTKIANARRMELRELGYRMARTLANENPRFDFDRFMDATGVDR